MVKTIGIIIGTSLITTLLVAGIFGYAETKIAAKYEEKFEKIEKKLNTIDDNTSYVSEKWVTNKINRNTTPTECRLENLKIDIQKATINGIRIFSEPVIDIAKKIPCVDLEDRFLKKKDTFYHVKSGYNGKQVYFLALDTSKSLNIRNVNGSAKPLILLNFEDAWRNGETIKNQFVKFEYENKSEELKVRKTASKTDYGCIIVNYHHFNNKDLSVRGIILQNEKCSESDVKILKSDKFN